MSQPSRAPRVTVLGVAGEVLLTLGVVVGLFVVWQLWWTNLDATAAQEEAVTEMAQQFDASAPAAGRAELDFGEPIVAQAPGYGQGLGIVYIPRFGSDYARPIMEGTGADVLDTLGLGHYEGTAMPGEVGNFAVAGHRQTNGKVLDLIHTLEAGDRIHVRTAAGYYVYVVEEHEIVMPSEVRVVASNPQEPQSEPVRKLMTMTSCHPRFGDTERYVVHAVLESWRPAQAGPPAEIAAVVARDTPGS